MIQPPPTWDPYAAPTSAAPSGEAAQPDLLPQPALAGDGGRFPPAVWDPYAAPSPTEPAADPAPLAAEDQPSQVLTADDVVADRGGPAYDRSKWRVTVDDVIAMVQADVDDELIIHHVREHGLAQVLTVQDLIRLKEEDVSVEVIRVMQNPCRDVADPCVPPPSVDLPERAVWPSHPLQPSRFPPAEVDDSRKTSERSPRRRMRAPIYTSESLEEISREWEQMWFQDNPDHETPYWTHGGII